MLLRPLIVTTLLSLLLTTHAWAGAANLMDVYKQALISDPTYQKAIQTELATAEGIAINRAALLPDLAFTATPTINRVLTSGSPSFPSSTGLATTNAASINRGYDLNMKLTQTIFNYTQFMAYTQAKDTAKAALATLSADAEDLMTRVAKAYFLVLEDQDNLRASATNKEALAKQLDQVTAEYHVGTKTVTDFYTAQASYESATAEYITSQHELANAKEDLRAITGILYPVLATLSDAFPFVNVQPSDINAWAETARKQNWQVKSNQFSLAAALHNVKQQFGGHLPTLNAVGFYDVTYNGINTQALGLTSNEKVKTASFGLSLSLPLFSGGQVTAEVRQAKDQYEEQAQALEQSIRETENSARQNYLGVIAGISKVVADRKAIQADQSSLDGLKTGYRVGTQTLVDVVNQQKKLLDDEKLYAHDRYAYINSVLALKQAAGLLKPDDLAVINAWLLAEPPLAATHAPLMKHQHHHSS